MASNSDEINNSEYSASLFESVKNPNEVQFQVLREEYHKISENLQQLADAVGKNGCSAKDLNDHVLPQLDKVFDKVQRPPEARLDAQILKQVCLLGKCSIEKAQSGFLEFKPSEYAINLVNFMNNGEALVDYFDPQSASLKRLSEEMALLYSPTYGMKPLCGAIEWNNFENLSKRTARRRKEDVEKIVVKSIDKMDDGRTDAENLNTEVNRIYKVLKRKFEERSCQPLPLLEFVIDPTCFSTTMENIFHTSFLMRDNHVYVSFNESNIPCLIPIGKKELCKRKASNVTPNKQAVLNMNVMLWKECIEVIGIEEAMIPNIRRNAKRPQ